MDLDLSNNQLAGLIASEFSTMSNLEKLNLKGNRIEVIDSDSFSGLFGLIELDLTGNRLKGLRSDVFVDIKWNLEKLVLDRNFFERVPRDALSRCGNVRNLYMYDNRVKVLDEYVFGFMGNLVEVYLGGNLIEEISEKAFFIDPTSLHGPGLIEKIDLSSNRLTSLKTSIFFYLVNLRYLQLNNNLLKTISPQVFKNVNHLISLDLSINQLTDFDLQFLASYNFKKLRNLKLSHNRLTTVQPSQFICLSSLTSLDLSSNQINKLSDCAFHGLQFSIKKLLLNYNQISQINSCSFSLEFSNLRFVQLIRNPLNCSNNCEFFYTVYRTPYSIDYKGIECVNNDFNLITTDSLTYCSLSHYENIYKKCHSRLLNNDCLISDKYQQMQKNQQGCEFQFKQHTFNSHHQFNWSLVGNRSDMQVKHKFLYNIEDSYRHVKLDDEKMESSKSSGNTSGIGCGRLELMIIIGILWEILFLF